MTCDLFKELMQNDTSFEDMTTAERTGAAKHQQHCEACREWFAGYCQQMEDKFGPLTPEEDLASDIVVALTLAKDFADPEAQRP